MTYLKNKDTNILITRFVSFRKTQDIIRTVQTALDGTEYLTRFGVPTVHYEFTAMALSYDFQGLYTEYRIQGFY